MASYSHNESDNRSATVQTREAIGLAVKASDQFPLTRPYSALSEASRTLLDSMQEGLSKSTGRQVGLTQAMAVVLAVAADMYGSGVPAPETATPAHVPSKAVAR